MENVEKDLMEFFDLLDKANSLIEGIKARHQQQEVSEAAHRLIKYSDSREEKARYKEYRKKGFLLRQIEEVEGLKKDVIAEKLKRYKLK